MTDLLARYDFLQLRESLDHLAYNCPSDRLMALLQALRDEHGYDLLSDVTAIDHFEASPRYEVVYHLFSTEQHKWVRIATPCAGDEEPVCPSVVSLWPGANWHERETYDMFGIRFEGHPDLRRILMWDGYPWYPLRKEFPLAGHEVELPSAETTERTGAKVLPAPMMGGPFHAPQRGTMRKREPRADDESWTEIRHKRPDEAQAPKPRDFNT